jgi:hypothetical protein
MLSATILMYEPAVQVVYPVGSTEMCQQVA